MPLPVCYLNGEFVALSEARISPLDRGFLFADSVYEVLPVFNGRMFRFREHFDRLSRSLSEIRLPSPHSHQEWCALLEELVRRNGGADMYLYVQVTRGMEFGRNHAFPKDAKSTVFAMASLLPAMSAEQQENGLSAITVEDFRWRRCDIKATTLLANVLMKQRAAEAGAQEAIAVENGEVLEGSSTTIFVVRAGVLITPPNSHRILPGTTRDVVLELAEHLMPVQIKKLNVSDLRGAEEVWIAAATRDVLPITRIDGLKIGTGHPGPWWHKMSRAFVALRSTLAGTPAFQA
ncbi:MAG: D-amino acid aminotransferase [Povalibacter sp.]